MNRITTRAQGFKIRQMMLEAENRDLEILSSSIASSTTSSNPHHYKGIQNLGFTCYANSILQVLYTSENTSTLIRNNKNLGQFHNELGILFDRMYEGTARLDKDGNTTYSYVKPNKFFDAFRATRSEFIKDEQHDAQEFFTFLLNFLHNEAIEGLMQTGEPSTAQVNYVDESPYSRLFMGQMESTLSCLACGHQSRSCEPFWQLQLNVPGDVVEGITIVDTTEPVPTLSTCIEYFLAEETMSGDCAPTCEGCKEKKGSKKQLALRQLPNILVLFLKRFTITGDKKESPVKVEAELTLSGRRYMLLSCVCHQGKNNDGHYFTLLREAEGSWTLFNDREISTGLSDSKAKGILLRSAYIAFYRAQDV